MMGSLKDVICGSVRDVYHRFHGELASNITRYCKTKYLMTSFYLDWLLSFSVFYILVSFFFWILFSIVNCSCCLHQDWSSWLSQSLLPYAVAVYNKVVLNSLKLFKTNFKIRICFKHIDIGHRESLWVPAASTCTVQFSPFKWSGAGVDKTLLHVQSTAVNWV